MFFGHPFVLRRIAAGVVLLACLGCPSLWGSTLYSPPRVLSPLWQKKLSAQVSGLDLTHDGQTVALTVIPFMSTEGSRLYVFDGVGKELWSAERDINILNVSLSRDGEYIAIGLVDFAIAVFSKSGTVLWVRQSVGLPQVASSVELVATFNGGVGGAREALLEAFHVNGERAWSLRRKGRVWRMLVSDRGDLLLGLWNDEVVLINRHRRLLWQQMFARGVGALAISPEDAQYVAVGTGVLG